MALPTQLANQFWHAEQGVYDGIRMSRFAQCLNADMGEGIHQSLLIGQTNTESGMWKVLASLALLMQYAVRTVQPWFEDRIARIGESRPLMSGSMQ